jgi:hypothetical protein
MLQMGFLPPRPEDLLELSLVPRARSTAGRSCHGCRVEMWKVNSEGELVVSLDQAGGRVPGMYICTKEVGCIERQKAKVFCINCIKLVGGIES